MRIQIISEDKKLVDNLLNEQCELSKYMELYSGNKNSLDILSFIISANPSLIILDDDFTSPHSAHLIESVRKVRKEQRIIFLTSDNSLQLGTEISSLGIQYYAIKPIPSDELQQIINSVIKYQPDRFN